MTSDLARRTLMVGSAAMAAATALPSAAQADPHPASAQTLTRIAFGSCAHQDKDQPVWDAVLASQPDLFVFLGDNIYGDTRDMGVLRSKYAQLAAKKGFKTLRDNVPIVAVWDDHDFGENDAGAEYPFSQASRDIFLEFWREPQNSPRRQRNGIYASYVFGPAGQRVQIILPDLRTNRTAISKLDLNGRTYDDWAKAQQEAGLPVPGPYARIPNAASSMIGADQWAWLEAQLAVPADIRIFGSSLQVLADFPGWESWIVYARDHQRLIETIRRTKASGLVFLSGDTHYAELSKLDVNVPYPLWDLTSSGLTEVWPVLPPNDNRVGQAFRDVNFGLIEITWAGEKTRLNLQVRDVAGAVKIEHTLALTQLRA